jgi:hypothetical protein
MEVCSRMVVDYLTDGVPPELSIEKYRDIKDYLAIRAVRGGGIQPTEEVEVDDWMLLKDIGTKDNEWTRPIWPEGKVLKRKSRPAPVREYRGGVPFGRIARWYMTTLPMPPIVYVSSGNMVPKSAGARICMYLPTEFPDDIDFDWYVNEAWSQLADMGVKREAADIGVGETPLNR